MPHPPLTGRRPWRKAACETTLGICRYCGWGPLVTFDGTGACIACLPRVGCATCGGAGKMRLVKTIEVYRPPRGLVEETRVLDFECEPCAGTGMKYPGGILPWGRDSQGNVKG